MSLRRCETGGRRGEHDLIAAVVTARVWTPELSADVCVHAQDKLFGTFNLIALTAGGTVLSVW